MRHAVLNMMNGQPSHSLSKAIGKATLTKKEDKLLRKVNKRANEARHNWPARDYPAGAFPVVGSIFHE